MGQHLGIFCAPHSPAKTVVAINKQFFASCSQRKFNPNFFLRFSDSTGNRHKTPVICGLKRFTYNINLKNILIWVTFQKKISDIIYFDTKHYLAV
jgi:hypothetical protein